MEPKKKGRPSQDKVWLSFSLSRNVAEYIKNLPDGERSKFVNDILAMGIAENDRIKVLEDLLVEWCEMADGNVYPGDLEAIRKETIAKLEERNQ